MRGRRRRALQARDFDIHGMRGANHRAQFVRGQRHRAWPCSAGRRDQEIEIQRGDVDLLHVIGIRRDEAEFERTEIRRHHRTISRPQAHSGLMSPP